MKNLPVRKAAAFRGLQNGYKGLMLAAAWTRLHTFVTPRRFLRLCVVSLVFVLGVIVWGALVRATGSGAGCGQHWPLCNGQMLPVFSRYQTLIEFFHRVTSGLSLLLVFTLGHFAFRLYGQNHPVRRFAVGSMVAMVIEALIGAALVLLRLVEHDRSVDRAISMTLHLGNTCFLLGALALLTWSAWNAQRAPNPLGSAGDAGSFRGGESSLRGGQGSPHETLALMVLGGFVVLAAAGALTALGDTLFEVRSFNEGWIRDWARDAHFLERLRVLHPVLALLWMVGALVWLQRLSSSWAKWALRLLISNLMIGAANVLLAAPVALQLVHLLVANLLWIALVLAWHESRVLFSRQPERSSSEPLVVTPSGF
jgi:heme A synthase